MKKYFGIDRAYLLGLLGIFILSLFLHRNVLTLDVQGAHAWRQTQTMWNVRNFVRHDANILNPRISYFNGGSENILRYEFPIFQYSIAMFQKVFGEKVIVYRLYMFGLVILTSFGFFYLIRDIFDNQITSLCATFLFQFSPLFYYYGYNPIPDNLALCGSIWYMVFILRFYRERKYWDLFLASVGLLVATLSKLPFLMFSIISIYFFVRDIISRKVQMKDLLKIPIIQLVILIPAFMWYIWVLPSWAGNAVMHGIFDNPLAYQEYINIIDYHLNIMFPRMLLFPTVWIIAFIGLIVIWKVKNLGWLVSLILITFLYLVFEFNAINSIHDYYMLPFLPWMYVIVAGGISYALKIKYKVVRVLILLALMVAPIDTYFSTTEKWGMNHDGFNEDVYQNKELLKNLIPNDELCIILNDRSQSIFSYNIDKMGHIFYNDELPPEWVGDMIDNYGITHVYSDSRILDLNPIFQKEVDTLLLSVGTVNVYKLRAAATDSIKYLPTFKKDKHVD